MKKKLLNLRGISDILSEKEMKYVVGGSSGAGSGNARFECTYGTASGVPHTTSCTWDFEGAYLICDFWTLAGYECSCKRCN